jgi:hypothetical protein
MGNTESFTSDPDMVPTRYVMRSDNEKESNNETLDGTDVYPVAQFAKQNQVNMDTSLFNQQNAFIIADNINRAMKRLLKKSKNGTVCVKNTLLFDHTLIAMNAFFKLKKVLGFDACVGMGDAKCGNKGLKKILQLIYTHSNLNESNQRSWKECVEFIINEEDRGDINKLAL